MFCFNYPRHGVDFVFGEEKKILQMFKDDI